MKPKCPRSWLPRVKLRRLRFIAASFGCGGAEPETGETAIVGFVRTLPQRTISMAGQERIQGNRDEEVLSYRVEGRSEEHTSELQSLMRISSAVFCLKKK